MKNATVEELKRALRANDAEGHVVEKDSAQRQVENRKATVPADVSLEEREKHERKTCRTATGASTA